MYKTLIPATLLTLLAASSAFAEHRLLVTDVPDPGMIETRLDFTYSRANGKNDLGEKLIDEKTGAAVTLGAGILNGLKFSAEIPYTLVQHKEGVEIDGFEDITLGVKYALTKSLLKLPFDAAVGFDWKLDSASSNEGKPGTGSNNYSPYLAVSKNLHTFIPYVKYQPDFIVEAHKGRTDHNLTLGAEIELNHHYTLDLAVKGVVNGHHEGFKSSTDVEIEAGPYINVTKNLYILPKVSYKVIGDIKDDTDKKVLRNADEYKVGLGVYCLF
jgi:hypothetical protein